MDSVVFLSLVLVLFAIPILWAIYSGIRSKRADAAITKEIDLLLPFLDWQVSPPLSLQPFRTARKAGDAVAVVEAIRHQFGLAEWQIECHTVDQSEPYLRFDVPLDSQGTMSRSATIVVARALWEREPLSWFVAGVAQNLAWLVLRLKDCYLHDNPRAVAYTAMIYGFGNILLKTEKSRRKWGSWLLTPFLLPFGIGYTPPSVMITRRFSPLPKREVKIAERHLERFRTRRN